MINAVTFANMTFCWETTIKVNSKAFDGTSQLS